MPKAANLDSLDITKTTEAQLRLMGVNSFRSPLTGKESGAKVTFVSTGVININRSEYENAQKEKIVSAYVQGQGGYRLKLNAGYKPTDYSAGKEIKCIVVVQAIDGVNRSWLSTAD